AALLHVPPDELLGVLLQHGVDLVEDVVDLLGDLLDAFADLRVDLRGLRVLDLGVPARAAGLRLTSGVAGSHAFLLHHVVAQTYRAGVTGCPWFAPAEPRVGSGRADRAPQTSGRARAAAVRAVRYAHARTDGAVRREAYTRRGYSPERASSRSLADGQRSNSSPTWCRVPRSGSIIGTRTSDSRPTSKITESQLARSEEHTSELQSRENLVCRLLLE